DAMSAAAEWIGEVERYAAATPALVATVGSVQTLPGAGNVIAGEVHATLDVRSSNDATREEAAAHLLAFAEQCGSRRGVAVEHTMGMQQVAGHKNSGLLRLLE